MNPLSTVSSSSLYEGVQRIDTSRSANPPSDSNDSRNQQVQRAQQPTSSVSVSISDTARSRASDDLAATQSVSGGNASSGTPSETRRSDEPRETVGRLVSERA